MRKILCFIFGHSPIYGYTNTGLPIYVVGGHTNKLWKNGPLWPIRIEDDAYYPAEIFNSYSQEMCFCSRCNTKLVNHKD